MIPGAFHHLGLRGNFAIADHCKTMARECGLQIIRLESGEYRLRPTEQRANWNALCPSAVAHGEGVFDAENLQKFLDFLRQPLRVSLDNHEERVIAHRLLRFAVSGSVEIPPDYYKTLETQSAQCHASNERAGHDAAAWATEREFGNTRTKVSSIPRTRVDIQSGFGLDLHSEVGFGAAESYQSLRRHFLRLLNITTGNRYKAWPQSVILTGKEIERFCTQIHYNRDILEKLIERAEFEELLQKHERSIQQHIDTDKTLEFQADIKQLLRASSALMPVLCSPAMETAWRRYRFSARHDPPSRAMKQEYRAMHAMLEKYGQDAVPEFMPLLAFFAEMASIMQRPDLLPEQFLNPEKVSDFHRKILTVLKKATRQAGSLKRQWAQALRDWTVDFIGDIKTFPKEHPRLAALFLAGVLAGGGYVYQTTQRTREAARAQQNTVWVWGENGLESVKIDYDSLPEEAKRAQSFHYHVFFAGLLWIKHYTYNNFIIWPTQTTLDLTRAAIQLPLTYAGMEVNPKPVFTHAAEATVKPLSNVIFGLDTFQNFSHVFFWQAMYVIGFVMGNIFGVKKGCEEGFKSIVEFFGVLADMAWQTGGGTAEMLRLRKKDDFVAMFKRLEKEISWQMPMRNVFEVVAGMQDSKTLSWGKAAFVAAAVGALTCITLDMAGAGNSVIDLVSKAAGYGLATLMTTAVFVVYNFFQDIVLIHAGSGGSTLVAGAVSGKAYGKIIKPAFLTAQEYLPGSPTALPSCNPSPTLYKGKIMVEKSEFSSSRSLCPAFINTVPVLNKGDAVPPSGQLSKPKCGRDCSQCSRRQQDEKGIVYESPGPSSDRS